MATGGFGHQSPADDDTLSTMNKLPTNTLKRNPKGVDLPKHELVKLLCSLEAEVQARDIAIAALKADRTKTLLYQAKYGRFGLGDPFLALQRDATAQRETLDENALKSVYDNQLLQLENLIETQRKGQLRMREQLVAVEKRYHQVCAELEDEKKKRAADAEESDALTCCLEKDRERLKSELEFQQQQKKKLDKELRRSGGDDKYQQIAMQLVTERQSLLRAISVAKQRLAELEETLSDEQNKTKEMAEALAALQSERTQEKEQATLQLAQLEKANRELQLRNNELEATVQKLDRNYISSPVAFSSGGHVTNSPKQTVASNVPDLHEHTAKQRPPWVSEGHTSPRKIPTPSRPRSAVSRADETSTPTSSTVQAAGMTPHNSPALQPPSHSQTAASSANSDNTTVFTTPSGTRISLNMKKSSGAARGTPPPLPPNKPQVVLRSPRPFQPERKHPPQSSDLHDPPNLSQTQSGTLQQPAVSKETGNQATVDMVI